MCRGHSNFSQLVEWLCSIFFRVCIQKTKQIVLIIISNLKITFSLKALIMNRNFCFSKLLDREFDNWVEFFPTVLFDSQR